MRVGLDAAVCLLALFNVTFQLHRQPVQEWDESLYATSAWEMLQSGKWVAHTFRGELDYYNTKPPLNFWLVALSFEAFGASLVSLRLASAAATLLTVAVVLWWARRSAGHGGGRRAVAAAHAGRRHRPRCRRGGGPYGVVPP